MLGEVKIGLTVTIESGCAQLSGAAKEEPF